MRKSVLSPLVLLLYAILLAGISVGAQDDNLLQNPGFEAPYNELEGQPPRQVAEGWTPWHLLADPGSPSFANIQPEYEPAEADSDRVMEGESAQLLRSFFATHDGGVYQQVSGITPGADLRFSVFAYVWSNTFDETDISEEDGDVFVQVGIDPAGGTDPESESVVWSPSGVEQYDAYNEYEVEAQAEGDTITVFVRTTIGVPVKNNEIYLDAASLVAAGAEATEDASPTEAGGEVTEEATAPGAEGTDVVIPTAEGPTPEGPTEDPGPDPQALTATAIIAEATQTASADFTATASVTEATATETEVPATVTPLPPTEAPTLEPPTEEPSPDPLALTATAIIAEATQTASADFTATAVATEAPATEDPLFLTATAISDAATATTVFSVTETAAAEQVTVPATATEDTMLLTATAIIADATATAAVNLTETATVAVLQPTNTAIPTVTPTAAAPPISETFPHQITHTVQRGESVAILAQRYDSSIDAIAQVNGLGSNYLIHVGQTLIIPVRSPIPATPTPTSTPITVVVTATPGAPVPELGSGNIYVVRPGDNLTRIARLFNTNVATLAQLNGIVNLDRIQVGQQLRLPDSTTPDATPTPVPTTQPTEPQDIYIVLPGDSLYRVSLLYGVTIAELAQANNITNIHRIYVGQALLIP